MDLWLVWYHCVKAFRPACRRQRTFLWMVVAMIGLFHPSRSRLEFIASPDCDADLKKFLSRYRQNGEDSAGRTRVA